MSDLHYRLPQFDWLSAVGATTADVVVIAGDMLDLRSAVPLDAQAIAVTAQLRAMGSRTTVLSASGNHDLDARDQQGEKTARWLARAGSAGVHVDGESVLVEQTLFTICPWWDGPQGQAALERRLEVDAARPKDCWVWVYHSPPSGSPLSWDGRREFGDDVVAGWIDRFAPDVVLAGHIHQAPFVPGGGWSHQLGTTWLFNAGHQPGGVPAHVVLDLDARTAVWTSATDRQEVALDGR